MSDEKAPRTWPPCATWPALDCLCRGAFAGNPTSGSGSCIRKRERDRERAAAETKASRGEVT